MTPDGLWIGWTDEEVALHFATYNIPLKGKEIPLKEPIKPLKENEIPLKENNSGCGRG
jgi:hypothetical protein